MGMHPSLMCGSGAFDDALQHLGENSDKFMSNPTVEQLVATINTLSESPRPQGDVSPDFESVDPTQAFNLDDFVKDFGVPASQECESFDLENITTTLSVVSRNRLTVLQQPTRTRRRVSRVRCRLSMSLCRRLLRCNQLPHQLPLWRSLLTLHCAAQLTLAPAALEVLGRSCLYPYS
ncbi:hypothetical protein BGY98DRAFT_58253 [Russula aff. rugulosa BPL654]|nr:hypothetical protein BGY98DRAFT_58253 [Russula aff. rugulosa BPL654]